MMLGLAQDDLVTGLERRAPALYKGNHGGGRVTWGTHGHGAELAMTLGAT